MKNQFDSNLDPSKEERDLQTRQPASVSQSPSRVVTGEMSVMPVSSVPNAHAFGSQKGKRWTRRIVGIIGLLVLLGGGAYASYYFKVWPFAPDPMVLKRQALRDAFDKLFTIESAKYAISLDMRVEDRDQAVPSLDAFRPAEEATDESGMAFLNDFAATDFDFMPSNASVTLQLEGEGSLQPSSGAVASRLAFSGEANMEGISMKASGELMLLNNTLFARVNEFPTMFSAANSTLSGIDAVRGRWIRVTMEDLANYWSYDPESTMQPFGAMDPAYLARSREASRKLYGIAIEEGVFSVDYSLPDVVASGSEHYRYGVKINAGGLPGFYRRAWPEFVALTSQAAEASGEQFPKFDQEPSADIIKMFESDEFKQFIAFVNSSSAIELMVDKRTGYMDKVLFVMRFAPGFDSVAPVTKQVSIAIESAYSNINQPVTLSEPTEFMNYEEAMQAVTGMSANEYKFSMQLSNVDRLRYALALYRAHAGAYPASLQALLRKRGEVPYNPDPDDQSAAIMGEPSGAFANIPFTVRIPKDIYSHQELSYSVDGNGYALKYMALVPQETAILTANQILRVVDGLNTATEAVFSRELDEALLDDLDEDGLPDIVELYYASSDAIADTDADGFTDGQEVKNGYNPAGLGTLEPRKIWTRPLPEPEFSLSPLY
ncbi:MAG: hypothetical protein A3B31_01070 [Candidatus Komeilibacteria bacterium RIFCSPLOWO2_01_FULL_53_11]|uniref:Uncharacterized protein n=1 Tax=Candidatus Komeilibacteria bacterium RIFCSPLOWO2_01_FULL_53_11 TaxID=1798552 RepID=A0A1G2BPY7_9BACT|nr:MAG: hypothetical protein A3B31_01070 [Candidatus Komeilibacteria bacterium RIFCSPLOWO2_01_FULL_53_11]